MRTGHAHQIKQTLSHRVASSRHIIDARGMHHGQIKCPLNLPGKSQVRCTGRAHVGNDIGQTGTRINVAANNTDEIDQAAGREYLTDLHPLIKRQTPITHFIENHTNANNIIVTNLATDFLQNFDAKPHSVFQ